MAARDATSSKPGALDSTVTLQGFDRVGGTARVEAAVTSEERTEEKSVGAQQDDQHGSHRESSLRQSVEQGLDLSAHFRAAGSLGRCRKSKYEVTARQLRAPQAERLSGDPLDQIALHCLARQLLCNNEADSRTWQGIGSVVQAEDPAPHNPAEGENSRELVAGMQPVGCQQLESDRFSLPFRRRDDDGPWRDERRGQRGHHGCANGRGSRACACGGRRKAGKCASCSCFLANREKRAITQRKALFVKRFYLFHSSAPVDKSVDEA